MDRFTEKDYENAERKADERKESWWMDGIPSMHHMFVEINKNCKVTGETVEDFDDQEYYASQIMNIFGCPESVAKRLAKELAEYAKNQ